MLVESEERLIVETTVRFISHFACPFIWRRAIELYNYCDYYIIIDIYFVTESVKFEMMHDATCYQNSAQTYL